MRSFAVLLLVGLRVASCVAETAAVPAGAAESRVDVRYRDDKVSADLRDAPLGAVLEGLAKASGADLVGTVRTERKVTLALERVPLAEALERLVGAQNFTLKYEDGGKLRAIELRGGQEAAPPAAAPDASPAEGNTTPPKWMAFYKAFDGRGRIPVPGNLRSAFEGRDDAGFDFFGNTAIANSDPRVRRETMRALLRAIEADPDLRAEALASLEAMSPAEMAELARRNAHYRAEDFVRNVMRETRDQEVRSRARDVLRELRKIPFKGPHHELR